MPPVKRLRTKNQADRIAKDITDHMMKIREYNSAEMEQLARCASAADRLRSELALLEQRYPLLRHVL